MKIDVHNHYYPENYWNFLLKIAETKTFPIDVCRIISYYANKGLLVKIEDAIASMEKLGIGIQVLSLSIPNVYMSDEMMSLDLAQMVNDTYVEIRNKYPGKFFVLASVPLNSPNNAIKELDRAIEKLKMNVIVLGSNIRGKSLSSSGFFPFYERVNELKIPIFLHPMSPPHMEEDEYFTAPLVNYIFETTLAITNMVFAGVFEKFPNIKMILPHLGGAIPYILGRIDNGYRNHSQCRKNISKKPSDFFKEFYYDIISFNIPAIKCAIEIVGCDHIVFGTDYPFQPLGSVALINKSLEDLNLSKKDKELIESRNILKILNNI